MLRLRSAYIAVVPLLLAAFHILSVGHRVPFALINGVFLAIAPVGLVYPDVFSYALGAFAWICLYPVFMLVYGVDPLNAALPICTFNLLQVGCLVGKKSVLREAWLWNGRLKEKESERAAVLEEFEKLSRFESGIKNKELATVNLYEITKKMSEDLRFEDIFKVFSGFLKENLTFRRCNLFVLDRESPVPKIDKAYDVWQEPAPAAQDALDFGKLAALFAGGFKEIYLSHDEDAHVLRDLGINDPAVKTMAILPLLSEKRMVALLTVENLPKADFENFIILSIQFALEIKKVLLYEMVERMAVTDSLTGLYVRRYFSEKLNEELLRSKRYKFSFALLMIDIDNFKQCNDKYGHLVGDVVLREMARIIKDNVREIDIVARYGGEEFSIVLPETTNEAAMVVAERLRKRIEEHVFKAYDEKPRVTISIGVAVYPADSQETRGIVEKADTALYAAKKSGKNVVCACKKEYNKRL